MRTSFISQCDTSHVNEAAADFNLFLIAGKTILDDQQKPLVPMNPEVLNILALNHSRLIAVQEVEIP